MKYLSHVAMGAATVIMAAGLAGCPDRDAVIDGIEFVWCPPGTFLMGRNPGELDSRTGEDPRHEVTFSQGFWMSKYEITQAQWKAVMGDNPSRFRGGLCNNTDNHPVDQVSWYDAQDFIAALNEARPGLKFRLPSEAEWEYACRAGTTTRFYWGDDPSWSDIGDYAWYSANSDGQTHDVGQKLPNAWGLYDMCGNVWEWVEDARHNDYTGVPVDGTAWESTGGPERMVRGGSWYNGEGCRSAFRGAIGPDGHYGDYGLRIVKD